MDKNAFFVSLYQEDTDEEGGEAEGPIASAPDLDLPGPKRLKTEHNQPKTAEHHPPKKSSRNVSSDPDPPFYCMDNTNFKKKARSVTTHRSSSALTSSRSISPVSIPDSPPPKAPPRREKQEPKSKKLPWLTKKTSEAKEPKKTKKTKKTKEKEIPEEKKIFRGLIFYYYPNSDVSPARRFQMKKAAERGAERAVTFGSQVTHLIVDSRCSFPEVLNHLQRSDVPSTIAVVNDYYAAECIEFGYILDPLRSRFRVKGHISAPTVQRSPSLPPVSEPERPEKARGAAGESPPKNSTAIDLKAPLQTGPSNLDEAIETIRQISNVSLDLLESADAESEDLKAESTVSGIDQPSEKSHWQERFQCMHAHPGSQTKNNPNARTIEILEQMHAYYERIDDTWRAMSYRRAIAALKRHLTKVTTREEALAISGIGERLADKIEEIVQTDALRRLENAQADPNDKALQLFTGVYGAGAKQAQAWISQGFRTLEDLTTHATLTATQRIGVERHGDFNARIPREEIHQHDALVRGAVAALEPRVEVVIGGSYRRGTKTSGDIDFLIIGSKEMSLRTLQALVFDRLVPALFEKGYLKCALATASSAASTADQTPSKTGDSPSPIVPSSSRQGKHQVSFSKWHGAAALPPSGPEPAIWRRIDFLVVPAAERGAALLYFTGSALFNRSMRLLARKRGMRLNQKGLWARPTPCSGASKREKDREPLVDGALLEACDERKIFEILGVPWREAHERNC